MNSHALYFRLLPVVRRIRFRRTLFWLAGIWFAIAVVVALLIGLNLNQQLDTQQLWLPVILLMALLTATVAWAARRRDDFDAAINQLERRFPDLDSTLVTAIEQRSEVGKPLGFLQQDVVRRAVNHSFTHSWTELVPGWQMLAAPVVGLLGLVASAISIVLMTLYAQPVFIEPPLQFADVVVDNVDYAVVVEPGNTEVEAGSSLLVLARFAEAIPPEATLFFRAGDEEPVSKSMKKSLEDPVFGARISGIESELEYWVEYAEQKTESFAISVFEFPSLIRADASLEFPSYTQLANKVIQDVRRVSAVQGTKIQLDCFVNKPLVSAFLKSTSEVGNMPAAIELEPDGTDPRKFSGQFELQATVKYELHLTDSDGRKNRVPPVLVFNRLKNQPPDLKLTLPRRDVQVSAIEELELAATAWDDFGVNSVGLVYAIAGEEPQQMVLLENGAAKKRHGIEHLLEFERLDARPDQLLSYHFWAEDFGPDGETRRVESDMFFAEVRHFEEIFRQGQAPPQGQQQNQQSGQNQQNAEQAQQLAELQKQIINATWKLIRRETTDQVSSDFESDTQTILESQNSALQQLSELAEKIDNNQSKAFVDSVSAFMNEAMVHLESAKNELEPQTLKKALSSEQSAYQGLLKLRAREHEVVRSQQRQQGQQQQQRANRSQQQLQQLNLEQDENRYEQERTAQEQQQQQTEAREDRQVLSRLRELARRQEDLNDRIKELQSALEKAESPEEREEIEKRLKSLREQQEQLLRDADELLDRMQQPENQQRMNEQSEQLEQARENIRQSSEALEKGQVSKAAAEGTRAQQNLEELRDEFQNQAAGQFTEQMRQMRNEAQELAQKQDEIRESLENSESAEGRNEARNEDQPSLNLDDDQPNLQEEFEEQAERVQDLRQSMRETIEEAESFEPLLAEQLYETYRKSERSRPDRALASAGESFRRGWTEDAKEEERIANEGIGQMREGIEKAAESILGDETEALREAQETLESLNQQLRQNMNAGRSEQPSQEERDEDADSRQASANGGSRTQQQDENQEQQERQPNSGAGERSQQGRSASESDSDRESEQETEQDPGGSQQSSGQSGRGNGSQQQPNDAENERGNQNRSLREDNPGDREPQDGNRRGMRDPQSPQDGNRNAGGFEFRTGGGNQRTMQRIFGEDFREWSDQLRDVEEMMADPDLRSEAARIRDEAKRIRREVSRHAAEPNWDLVEMKISRPLIELQDRVSEEILRRTSDKALVPLNRDPVPAKYQDAVRNYFERIGSGE